MQDAVTVIAVGNIFIYSEIGAKSFGDGSQDIVSIKKVNWDQLLAFRALILERKAFLNFCVLSAQLWERNKLLAYHTVSLVLCFLFRSSSRSFFRLNHLLRKV